MIITYTPEAIRDLIRLRKFIDIKNPQAAQRIAKALRQGIQQLKTFPHIGTEVAEAPNPEIVRDLILGDYVTRYLVSSKIIHILRIWHHKGERL